MGLCIGEWKAWMEHANSDSDSDIDIDMDRMNAWMPPVPIGIMTCKWMMDDG